MERISLHRHIVLNLVQPREMVAHQKPYLKSQTPAMSKNMLDFFNFYLRMAPPSLTNSYRQKPAFYSIYSHTVYIRRRSYALTHTRTIFCRRDGENATWESLFEHEAVPHELPRPIRIYSFEFPLGMTIKK